MAGHAVRRRTLVAVTTLSLLGVLALAALIAVRNHDQDPAVACAGSTDFCDLRLDEVALATTHNSMAAAEDGFTPPSQTYGIAEQLETGIRGFLVDARLGTPTEVDGATVVRNARLAAPGTDVYLCHEDCELGAVRFSDVVGTWRTFLDQNPGEVLVVIVQDELPVDLLLDPLSGLAPYLARLDPHRPLPTLGEMVASGHRVVIGLENGDLGPTIPNVYADGLVQEVPYDYRSVEALTRPGSCRPHRGSADAPLFLLNNWVTPPSAEVAAQANATDLLVERARTCAARRGRPVNLVAVDFAGTGGVIEAVTELNTEVG